jgi:hypothetical protein
MKTKLKIMPPNYRNSLVGGIDPVKYHRTHCNYKEYIDFDFMSSNLLKNIVDEGVLKKKVPHTP